MGAFALGVVDITIASEMTLNYAHYYYYWFYYLLLLVLLLIISTFGGVIATF